MFPFSTSTVLSYFSNPTPERTSKTHPASLHTPRQATAFSFSSVSRALTGLLMLGTAWRLSQVPGAFAASATAEENDNWIHASRQKRTCDVLNISIANPIPNQIVPINVPFNYTLGVNTWLSGPDLDGLVLEACLADGSPLPSWLNFSLPPIKLGSYAMPGSTCGVAVTNGVAYVADSASGLQIINVSTPSTPTWLGNYSTPGFALRVEVTNGVAYLADYSSGLQIINVSTPSTPTLLGSYATSGSAHGVAVANGVAYVADYSSGLQIINVSTPSSPTWLGNYSTPGCALRVAVANGVAYVADRTSGLQIINVSTPSSPTWLGNYAMPGLALGVAVANGVAYVAYGASGLQIIDVSAPSTPTWLGNYSMPGCAHDVAVANGVAYVADETSGLRIIDVSAPSTPVLLGIIPCYEDALSVTMTHGVAYVAAYFSGLEIIDVSHWQLLGTPISADAGTLNITVRIKNSAPEVNNTFTLFVGTVAPTLSPHQNPSASPTTIPTLSPTQSPRALPTTAPILSPTQSPSVWPTAVPTVIPTQSPSVFPSTITTLPPDHSPSVSPTTIPTLSPNQSPRALPTTTQPTMFPTASPTTLSTGTPRTTTPATMQPTTSLTTTPAPLPDTSTHAGSSGSGSGASAPSAYAGYAIGAVGSLATVFGVARATLAARQQKTHNENNVSDCPLAFHLGQALKLSWIGNFADGKTGTQYRDAIRILQNAIQNELQSTSEEDGIDLRFLSAKGVTRTGLEAGQNFDDFIRSLSPVALLNFVNALVGFLQDKESIGLTRYKPFRDPFLIEKPIEMCGTSLPSCGLGSLKHWIFQSNVLKRDAKVLAKIFIREFLMEFLEANFGHAQVADKQVMALYRDMKRSHVANNYVPPRADETPESAELTLIVHDVPETPAANSFTGNPY